MRQCLPQRPDLRIEEGTASCRTGRSVPREMLLLDERIVEGAVQHKISVLRQPKRRRTVENFLCALQKFKWSRLCYILKFVHFGAETLTHSVSLCPIGNCSQISRSDVASGWGNCVHTTRPRARVVIVNLHRSQYTIQHTTNTIHPKSHPQSA